MELLALIIYIWFFSWVFVEIITNSTNIPVLSFDAFELEPDSCLFILFLPLYAVGLLLIWLFDNEY